MSFIRQLLDFYDAPASGSFDLPPAAAIAYFQSKGLKVTFDWRDMLGAEHASAFTVAKMADIDMLADVQASLQAALEQGLSYQSWADTITPLLQQKGWWGRQAVTDPLTGETIVAQLGSPGRLETIFRTNMQSAYAAGAWQQIQEQKDVAEFLLYDAVDDWRTRPAHRAWDGTVLPVDSDWWRTHYPPNGWNCRCGVIQLSADELEEHGLAPNVKAPVSGTYPWTNPRTGKAMKVPAGLDPGWDSNPGATHLAKLQQLAAEKIKALDPKMATAAAKGLKAAEQQAKDAAQAAGVEISNALTGSAGQLAKGAGKAQTRQAQAAIAKALKENTPYLAKSIQKIQATKAGAALDPVELLAKAQADAGKVKDSAALANWKQAKLAGKPGNAAGQAVFDALPEPAQSALLAEIDAKTGAAAAQKAIQAEIDSIAAGELGPVAKANLLETQANHPDWTPEQTLKLVKAQPMKLSAGQQSGGLNGWKKNAIAGKPPTAKQQLAFDSLNEKQKANALAQVQAAKDAKAVQAQAIIDPAKADASLTPAQAVEAEIDAKAKAAQQLVEDQPKLKKALAEMFGDDNDPDFFIDDEALADLAESLDADLDEFKAEVYAKAGISDHLPSTSVPAPPPTFTPTPAGITPGPLPISDAVPDLNPGQLSQIGPQRGSNPGGTYVDSATGTEWYLKFPASEEMARNEVLAAKLYEAVGIDVPDLRLITMPDGRRAVASRIEAGLTKGTPAQLAKGGAFDGFAADAWLANWDVAGATMDNLLVKGGRAFRVDTGGALRFRAQGGLKGTAWGDEVLETQSLRNTGTAPQAAKVFGKMKPADIDASVAKVLAVDDATIDRLLLQYGPQDTTEREALSARLKARRDDLERQYPKARTIAAPREDAPDTARVTAREQADIEASRVNGYTFRTDGDMIEDQNVIVSQLTTSSGKPVTRVFLKVRDPGEAAIKRQIGDAAATGYSLQQIRDDTLSLLKSINSRHVKGTAMDATVTTKWQALNVKMADFREMVEAGKRAGKLEGLDLASAEHALQQVAPLHDELLAYIRRNVSTGKALEPFRQVDLKALPDIAPGKPTGKPTHLPWQKSRGSMSYDTADFTKSNARLNGNKAELPGVSEHYSLAGDGYTVRFIPTEAGNSVSSAGTVMIDIEGTGAAATARGFEIIEKIGVKATRSTQAERTELYLDRIAYLRTLRNPKLEEAYAAAGKIADPTARAEAKLKLLNADAGKDLTKSRYWNPEGEHQAFGHGRVINYRPDLDDAEVAAFAKDYVIYHSASGLSGRDQWASLRKIVEGGGQIGSQIDRMRRGVASFGSSVSQDHTTGGANYIFTRLRSRASGYKKAGVYWNPEKMMRRSDAFSYSGDRFGQVSRDTQRVDRQIDPKGWRANAKNGSNETNFRDSVSLFDDVEKIVLSTRAEYNQALADMRAMGYRTWPDGRALEDVFTYISKGG